MRRAAAKAARPRRARTTKKAASPRRAARDPLALYRSKRAFDRTREPRGAPREATARGNSFVVQKHDATRLHYDFRLELDGVLLSWAVPKGPSLSPQDKRLAVQTEDHPVSYREFEGAIPEGHYGAGDVIVWDRGTWAPQGDPRAGLDKGHLDFELEGERLHGAFTLIRTRGGRGAKAERGPGSHWLLFKRSDAHARSGAQAEITQREQGSVISGRPLPARRRSASTSRAAPGRVTAAMPTLDRIEPQLATAVDHPPPGTQWVYEIKFDGYRLLASLDGDDVRLRSRNQLDWTHTFPAVAEALRALALPRSIIDGELCFVTDQGTTSFQDLQRVLPRGGATAAPVEQAHLVFYVFDLLFHDGEDLRELGLLERKARLRSLLEPPRKKGRSRKTSSSSGGPPLAYSEHLAVDGRAALTQACQSGLEGLIAKRSDAPYVSGRSAHWLKLKCRRRQEFVIVGMVAPLGGVRRSGFRSLLLALHEADGGYRYCGRVGTGFDQAALEDLSRRLQALAVDKAPVRDPPRERGITWVLPELVCEIDFAEFTRDGLVRQASFQGLRLDKPAARVERERTRAVETVTSESAGAAVKKNKKKTGNAGNPTAKGPRDERAQVMGVTISHPDRVVDASSQLSKLELARYHERVSEWMLPYALDRFLALVRCPEGNASQCFFQKQKPQGVGPSVAERRFGGHEVLFIREARGLIELVQFNAIEFHGWGSRAGDPKHPDWIVIDLDPDSSLGFPPVIEAAFEVREALASVGLRSFVKTTGGKGLHVVAPLQPPARAGWDVVKRFAQGVATALATRSPERYVANMSKAKRVGRIFVDYLRNGEGATAILPYSARARAGATVAMPVSWEELRRIDPRAFTVREAHRWLGRRRRDPWAEFFEVKQALPALDDEAREDRRRKR